MPLVLDGQKTCRIFENLVVNITKYGMPGTRGLYHADAAGARRAGGVQKHFRHRAGFQRGRDHRPLCAGRPFPHTEAAAWALPLQKRLWMNTRGR